MALKKTNEKDQIINSFENALQNVGKITPDKLNQAIDTIVRMFDENETETICPYISKHIGIAEWIVQYDIKQRYGKMKKACGQCFIANYSGE